MEGITIAEKLKQINLLNVCFLITEAWSAVEKSVIISSWKHLFNSKDELVFNLPADHFEEIDEVPLANIYRKIVQNTNVSDEEIQSWATGSKEQSLLTDSDIIDDAAENIEVADNTTENFHEIDRIIKNLNETIDWAESSNIELSQILSLRLVRETAMLRKINSSD